MRAEKGKMGYVGNRRRARQAGSKDLVLVV
jgi:hypothetical protein